MRGNRRWLLGCLWGGLMVVASAGVDLYDEPRSIVEAILDGYTAGKPPLHEKLPLVHRLRTALARTDLAVDIVVNAQDYDVSGIVTLPTRMTDRQRGTVEAQFSNMGRQTRVFFDFDRTSGDWLITDIRHSRGTSLRGMLQIPPQP